MLLHTVAVGHPLLDVADRVAEPLGVVARRSSGCETRGAARPWRRCRAASAAAPRGGQRLGKGHAQCRKANAAEQELASAVRAPGSSARPSAPASADRAARRPCGCASLIAATIRSCSISTSSFETTSGIDRDRLQLLGRRSRPPSPCRRRRSPRRACSAICFCRRSCICCACFIIAWIFIPPTSPRRP